MQEKAVILLSGGVGSTTCLAMATTNAYECYTLTIDYGQRSQAEITAAAEIAKHYRVEQHRVMKLPLNDLGSSALTDESLNIPDYEENADTGITYVPARNTVFLSVALAYAEVVDAKTLFFGADANDHNKYPDCRPEYIAAFERLANLATKNSTEGKMLNLRTPLINITKAEVLRLGHEIGIDHSKTISCYQADNQGRACGTCWPCVQRRKGFSEVGLADVTCYQPQFKTASA